MPGPFQEDVAESKEAEIYILQGMNDYFPRYAWYFSSCEVHAHSDRCFDDDNAPKGLMELDLYEPCLPRIIPDTAFEKSVPRSPWEPMAPNPEEMQVLLWKATFNKICAQNCPMLHSEEDLLLFPLYDMPSALFGGRRSIHGKFRKNCYIMRCRCTQEFSIFTPQSKGMDDVSLNYNAVEKVWMNKSCLIFTANHHNLHEKSYQVCGTDCLRPVIAYTLERTCDDLNDLAEQQSIYSGPGDGRLETYPVFDFESLPTSSADDGLFFTALFDPLKCLACLRTKQEFKTMNNPADCKWNNDDWSCKPGGNYGSAPVATFWNQLHRNHSMRLSPRILDASSYEANWLQDPVTGALIQLVGYPDDLYRRRKGGTSSNAYKTVGETHAASTEMSSTSLQERQHQWMIDERMANMISADHKKIFADLYLNRELDGSLIDGDLRITLSADLLTGRPKCGPAGFFYLGDIDRTQFFFYGKVFASKTTEDDAADEMPTKHDKTDHVDMLNNMLAVRPMDRKSLVNKVGSGSEQNPEDICGSKQGDVMSTEGKLKQEDWSRAPLGFDTEQCCTKSHLNPLRIRCFDLHATYEQRSTLPSFDEVIEPTIVIQEKTEAENFMPPDEDEEDSQPVQLNFEQRCDTFSPEFLSQYCFAPHFLAKIGLYRDGRNLVCSGCNARRCLDILKIELVDRLRFHKAGCRYGNEILCRCHLYNLNSDERERTCRCRRTLRIKASPGVAAQSSRSISQESISAKAFFIPQCAICRRKINLRQNQDICATCSLPICNRCVLSLRYHGHEEAWDEEE